MINLSFLDASLMQIALYGGAVGLIAIGLYGMVAERNFMRILLGLAVLESGVNLFLVAVGFRSGSVAPILREGGAPVAMVDPLPQALVLTAIVIGVGVLALGLAFAIKLKAVYGTLDVQDIAAEIASETGDEPVLPALEPVKSPAGADVPAPVAARAATVGKGGLS